MVLTAVVCYSLLSYCFSGSVCYLAVKADHENAQRSSTRGERIAISLFWPIWLMRAIR